MCPRNLRLCNPFNRFGAQKRYGICRTLGREGVCPATRSESSEKSYIRFPQRNPASGRDVGIVAAVCLKRTDSLPALGAPVLWTGALVFCPKQTGRDRKAFSTCRRPYRPAPWDFISKPELNPSYDAAAPPRPMPVLPFPPTGASQAPERVVRCPGPTRRCRPGSRCRH